MLMTMAVSITGCKPEEDSNDEGGGGSNTDNHAYVDLGLPSGTLWATCNVGADEPEGFGDYYAWGETTAKTTYKWSTYQYSEQDGEYLFKYCGKPSCGYNGYSDQLIILQPSDDAATANWGVEWVIPTKAQWEELCQNTTHTWTTQNGVTGRLFTASNGNSLFLPAAGYMEGSKLDGDGSDGPYWSSSLYTNYPFCAWNFFFRSNEYYMYHGYRDGGLPVRPVRSAR